MAARLGSRHEVRPVPDLIKPERAWKGLCWLSVFLGELAVKKLLKSTYRSIRKADPAGVFDPTKPGFSWPDALLWAATAGIGLVIARIVSARVAAIGWEAATGTRPPGVVEERAVG